MVKSKMELSYFSKSTAGFSHTKLGKPCQDFSASYRDEEKIVVTACDGHGGNMYVRSGLGSKFASDAVMRVFSTLDETLFLRYTKEELIEKLRLNILCEWNALVENDIFSSPIRKKEFRRLSEQDKISLKADAIKAYGTTLNGAAAIGGKLVCVSLGDGGVFLIQDGAATPAFEDDDEPVANITHSMCQEDAYNHLKAEIFDFNDFDGVFLCTDGLLNPYGSLSNFSDSLVMPTVKKCREGKMPEIAEFVNRLGAEIGTGDDVSLSFILKPEEREGN